MRFASAASGDNGAPASVPAVVRAGRRRGDGVIARTFPRAAGSGPTADSQRHLLSVLGDHDVPTTLVAQRLRQRPRGLWLAVRDEYLARPLHLLQPTLQLVAIGMSRQMTQIDDLGAHWNVLAVDAQHL